jgi:hypothetical protein
VLVALVYFMQKARNRRDAERLVVATA